MSGKSDPRGRKAAFGPFGTGQVYARNSRPAAPPTQGGEAEPTPNCSKSAQTLGSEDEAMAAAKAAMPAVISEGVFEYAWNAALTLAAHSSLDRELQAAVDTAMGVMRDSEHVGGPSQRDAWRAACAALAPFETQHASAGERTHAETNDEREADEKHHMGYYDENPR